MSERVYVLIGNVVTGEHGLYASSPRLEVIKVSYNRRALEQDMADISEQHAGYWEGTISGHDVEGIRGK